ncbi:hypothetical protein N2152v2_010069 [Parachlorella kessleri]
MVHGVALLTDDGNAAYECASTPTADDYQEGLRHRGPDHQGAHELRGTGPSTTPLLHTDPAGDTALLFNGEVFSGLEVPPGANDGKALLEALSRPDADVPTVLSRLRGPWAIALWHGPTQTMWYGRDVIGRRSLLVHLPRPSDGRLILASSAPLSPQAQFEGFEELSPGLYSISFKQTQLGELGAVAAAAEAAGAGAGPGAEGPFSTGRSDRPASSAGLPSGSSSAQAAAGSVDPALSRAVDGVLAALRSSLAVRCRCIEDHGNHQNSAGAPSWRSPEAGRTSQQQQQQVQQRVQQVEPSQDRGQACETAAPASDTPGGSNPVPTTGTAEPSVAAIVTPPLPAGPTAAVTGSMAHVPPAPILILFSGGLDSTLMAALAHEALLPDAPIDLASICFAGGTSPDRLAALDAVEELRAFAPSRQWRLIQVDATLDNVDALRPYLLRLLAPCDTVMDLNIGAALWLATRAEGRLLVMGGCSAEEAAGRQQGACWQGGRQEQQRQQQQQQQQQKQYEQQQQQQQQYEQQEQLTGQTYRSAARVVLLGHGADELCGGYGRHRTRFRESGWAGLEEELALDMRRLWKRNLGRDDRLVADHGREARHPFLDEGVVAAVLGTPLELVADLRLPAGVGDKLVLRECLRRLGLSRAAGRVKRAIQFGSSLGKQSNRRDFGSNRAANARSAGSLRLAELSATGT